jgi:Tfp pilus assembly protein PilV
MNHRSKGQIDPVSKSKGISCEGGFTIVETAIALVVMMVMALAVVSLFILAIKYNSGANDRALALAIAQQRMERLRKTRFSDASLSTASSSETYISSGHSYSILTTICSTSDCGGSASSKLITVQVTPNAASSQWANTAATMMTRRSAVSIGGYYP